MWFIYFILRCNLKTKTMNVRELKYNNYAYECYWCNETETFKNTIIQLRDVLKSHAVDVFDNAYNYEDINPIPLTEDLFLKCYIDDVKAEYWGNTVVNEYEYYTRYVFHNVIDGTSNLEIHVIHFDYEDVKHLEYKLSIDQDERQGYAELKYLHQLQNGVFWITNRELNINI